MEVCALVTYHHLRHVRDLHALCYYHLKRCTQQRYYILHWQADSQIKCRRCFHSSAGTFPTDLIFMFFGSNTYPIGCVSLGTYLGSHHETFDFPYDGSNNISMPRKRIIYCASRPLLPPHVIADYRSNFVMDSGMFCVSFLKYAMIALFTFSSSNFANFSFIATFISSLKAVSIASSATVLIKLITLGL